MSLRRAFCWSMLLILILYPTLTLLMIFVSQAFALLVGPALVLLALPGSFLCEALHSGWESPV